MAERLKLVPAWTVGDTSGPFGDSLCWIMLDEKRVRRDPKDGGRPTIVHPLTPVLVPV